MVLTKRELWGFFRIFTGCEKNFKKTSKHTVK